MCATRTEYPSELVNDTDNHVTGAHVLSSFVSATKVTLSCNSLTKREERKITILSTPKSDCKENPESSALVEIFQTQNNNSDSIFQYEPKKKINNEKNIFKNNANIPTSSSASKSKPKPPLRPITENVDDRLYNACLTGRVKEVKAILDVHFPTIMPDANGRTPLFTACIGNQEDVVKFLVNYGFDINHQDKDGRTALHVAYEHSLLPIVRLLNRLGANHKVKDHRKWTPRHCAVDIGVLSQSDRLIDSFLPDDVGTDLSWLQLQAAVYENSITTVQLLLDNHANVNRLSSASYTALNLACMLPRESIIHLLLAAGADPNIEDDSGETSLHWAVHEHCDPLTIQALIANGASVNYVDYNLRTPLHVASAKNQEYIIKLLVIAGADVNAMDEDEETCLHYIIRDKLSTHTMQFLIEHGAKLDARDTHGRTPLYLACSTRLGAESPMAYLHTLLEAGADPNIGNDRLTVPLHLAVYNNSVDEVEVLLKHSANPWCQDIHGLSPRNFACQRYNPAIFTLLDQCVSLVDREVTKEPELHIHCRSGRIEDIKLLLQEGADKDEVYAYSSPLEVALSYGHKDIVCTLIDAGANVSVQASGLKLPFLWSIYHQRRHYMDILKYMLESDSCNMDLRQVNSDGETLLYQACRDDAVEVLALLLAIGRERGSRSDIGVRESLRDIEGIRVRELSGDIGESLSRVIRVIRESSRDIGVNICDRFGKSALAIACKNASRPGSKSVEIVSALMTTPYLDVTSVDSEGKTALHRACQSDSIEIVTLLLDAHNGLEAVHVQDFAGNTPRYYARSPQIRMLMDNLLA